MKVIVWGLGGAHILVVRTILIFHCVLLLSAGGPQNGDEKVCLPPFIRTFQIFYLVFTSYNKISDKSISKMRTDWILLVFINAIMKAERVRANDGCPKDEYACHDVIDSSLCIEQLIIERRAPVTKEALIKCVEYEGAFSDLPGASKVITPQ